MLRFFILFTNLLIRYFHIVILLMLCCFSLMVFCEQTWPYKWERHNWFSPARHSKVNRRVYDVLVVPAARHLPAHCGCFLLVGFSTNQKITKYTSVFCCADLLINVLYDQGSSNLPNKYISSIEPPSGRHQ